MKKKRKRRLKLGNLLLVLFIFFGLIAGLVFGGAYLTYQSSIKAPSSTSEVYEFTIENGDSGTVVLNNLEEIGGIKSALFAKVFLKFNDLSNFRLGTYELDKSWDLEKVLSTLNDPTAAITDTTFITFVEGDWLKHIANKVGEKTNVSSDELLSLWNDHSYVKELQNDYPFISNEVFNDDIRYTLEGYLFPNTYEFFRETNADEVTRKLLDQTKIIYDKYSSDIKASSYTFHELLTLASIVQYESSTSEDMKLIAGVFYNRLNAGMPLQSSVTVCYSLDIEKDDDWMACEVNPTFNSPYNTYMIGGLPPGPILNPGEDAINAVLHPTESNYYYFMADVYGDGTVYYAETLEEHNANVRKYLY